MFRTLLATLTVLTGCATIPTPTAHLGPRVSEPLRSNFVVACVMGNQIPVTSCLCFEEVLVKMRGNNPDSFTQLDMAVAQQKCMEVLDPILKKELEELMKELQELERKNSI